MESWPWAVLLYTMGVLMACIYHKEPWQQFSKTICVSGQYLSCWRYDYSRIPEVPYERALLAGNSVWDEEHQCHQTAWVWHPIQVLFPDIKLTVPITHDYSCVIKSIIASFERRSTSFFRVCFFIFILFYIFQISKVEVTSKAGKKNNSLLFVLTVTSV